MRARKAWWSIALGIVLMAAMVLQAVGARYVGTEETFESYADQAAAVTAGFVFGSPWKLVTEGQFWGEGNPPIPFNGSSDQAVYVGYIDPDTGVGWYDGIPVEFPTLRTDVQTLSATCDYLTASQRASERPS